MDLKTRATNVLTRPAHEWPIIATEPSSPADLMTNYAAPTPIYLFYLGLPALMHTPPDKVIPFMVVAAILLVVLFVAGGVLAGAITGVRAPAIF